MPATREELIARWETEEGKALAGEALQALRSPAGSKPGPIRPLDAAFLQRLQVLPFVTEVAPQIDLRGLHLENRDLDFNERDLSGVRLDYAFPINFISDCRVAGTIFDHTYSVYGSFLQEDLQGISLVGASFPGAVFSRANLSEANLQGACLALANLTYANCSQANLQGVDARFSDANHANLCGADLREASFTESNLGAVAFDEQTLVQGADLRGCNLSNDFRAFARQRGALLTDEQTSSVKELAQLDATLKHLRQNNIDGHLNVAITLVQAERDKFEQDSDYQYYQGMEEAFARAGSPQLFDEVMQAWMEASKALAHFL